MNLKKNKFLSYEYNTLLNYGNQPNKINNI